MIAQATADALVRIAARAEDVRGVFAAGFEPRDPSLRAAQAPAATFDPLSVVAPPDTYFLVALPGGERETTRDGAFALRDGVLVSRDGRPVLGFADGETHLAPLHADSIDVALERVEAPRIDADGTLSYERAVIDPRDGARRRERVPVGRVALAAFPAGTRAGDRAALGSATTGVPGAEPFAPLMTFARDRGALDPILGLERLQEAYVSLEALRAAQVARGGLARTAFDVVK